MEVTVNDGGKPCKLCGVGEGSLTINYPAYELQSGDFTAPKWQAHSKYYCPHCDFLWSDMFDALSLAEYGEQYVKANYDKHRIPAEERMKGAPLLLRELVTLTSGSRFLDYGVGYNVPYIYELRGRGIDLWGCDISARVPYSRFVKYLPENDMPYGTFDGLYSIDVAEHLSDVINDYIKMKDLLKPGGYILHSTYWLHSMWKPDVGLPIHPVLRNPWHVSLCSEKTMRVIAEKTGLIYVKSLQIKVGPGTAYLLKKPGKASDRNFIVKYIERKTNIERISEHMKYVRNSYTHNNIEK